MPMLHEEHCRPPGGSEQRLTAQQVEELLNTLDGWQIDAEVLFKEFRFDDFKDTMLFANTVAWLAEREHHYPDLDIGFRRALVSYRTHELGGLSRNDFICAAKIEALVKI